MRDVTLGYGNYFDVTEVCGTFDIENGGICNIGYFGTIGTQQVRSFRWNIR